MMNIGNIHITEQEYLQVIMDKTAGILMETACRGGAILGGLDEAKEEALAQFGLNLGIAFQMTDDVIDYRSDVETMGKNPGKDIEEGKLTLPLIAALRNANEEETERVRSMLQARELSEENLPWIRDFVDRRGGIAYTLEKSRAHLDKAAGYLSGFPASEEKEALMKLTERILHRTY